MIAGEASNPRKTLKTPFNTVYFRFGIILTGRELCYCILIPYNDTNLIAILCDGSDNETGAATPYVNAMQNLCIGILPHITSALLVTSIS
jgi:amino acid transporter